MMFVVFLLATVILATLTLLLLWRYEAWWVRSMDFPRLQLFVSSLLLFLVESVLLDLSHPSTWCLLVVALLCLVYQAWWILTPNRNAKALIELVFEAGHDVQQNGLEADVDDLAWGKAKADDQNVNKSDVPQPGS